MKRITLAGFIAGSGTTAGTFESHFDMKHRPAGCGVTVES
jgi:hypothetical protein